MAAALAPVDLAYQTQLERVSSRFAAVPGRFSEANVTRLGSLNHFETFEDTVNGCKRLSLSGSIVVLDIDLQENEPVSVSVSLASADAQDPPRYLHSDNDPNKCILESLRLPRLDRFTQILEFLSRCDRFSTKDVDCFLALDQIGRAVQQMAQSDHRYGHLRINPDCMGTALEYTENKLAFIDITSGSNRKYALVQTNWIEDGQWRTPEPCQFDVRAELILSLEPPVILPASLAKSWDAEFKRSDSPLVNRRIRSSFTIDRHPKFRTVESNDTFDVSVMSYIADTFVSVSQIPLEHPKHIPEILDRLRQYHFLEGLIASLNRGDPIFYPMDLDISIADVIELKNTPVPTQLVSVDVTVESTPQNDVLVTLSIPNANCVAKVQIKADFDVNVECNLAVNQPDLNKLVQAKNLALFASYITGSLGVKHHRMSISV